jgi:hypothetical protein
MCRLSYPVYFETAFSSARAWSIWSSAYGATEMTQTDRQGNFRAQISAACDVGMVAPRMLGREVRECYVEGRCTDHERW